MSVQGKYISEHSKNRKGDHNIGWSIIQTKSVFDGIVISKKVFLESSHRIDTHLDGVVESLDVQSSVSFEFYLDE